MTIESLRLVVYDEWILSLFAIDLSSAWLFIFMKIMLRWNAVTTLNAFSSVYYGRVIDIFKEIWNDVLLL